jgi:nucleotide-binding universal stress UspA family protein
MATHGRTGLSHMILGSTAEKVVRHATVPVLTVKSPGTAFEAAAGVRAVG